MNITTHYSGFFKGSAANLSADGIAKAARELEQAGRAGNLADGEKIINALNDESSSLEDFDRRAD